MLHEILLALLGHPGNLIIKSELHFEINPLITFLSSAEKDLINRILPLGSYFQSLSKILTRIHQEETSLDSQGLYLKALAQGVEEILDGYKEIILEIERDFLENRVFTLSLLALKLNKYMVFLKEIEEFLQGIIKENVKGAQIIDAIMRKKAQSNQLVNEIYEVFLRYCYQILYNQVKSLIVCDKFFYFICSIRLLCGFYMGKSLMFMENSLFIRSRRTQNKANRQVSFNILFIINTINFKKKLEINEKKTEKNKKVPSFS